MVSPTNNGLKIYETSELSPFPVKRSAVVDGGIEFAKSTTIGGAFGFVAYYIMKLSRSKPDIPLQPGSFILLGVTLGASVVTAKLLADVVLHGLGKRDEYENLENPEEASDQLRQWVWKKVTCFEKLMSDIDTVFSRILHIHSTQEIKDQELRDHQLCFLEIVRRSFWEEVHSTIKGTIPQELGIRAMESLGYRFAARSLILWSNKVFFVVGIVNRVLTVYNNRQFAVMAQPYKEMENKAYCNLLMSLYPTEYAEFEANNDLIRSVDDDANWAFADKSELDIDDLDVNLDNIDDDNVDVETDFAEECQLEVDEFAKVVNGTYLNDHKGILNYRHTVFQTFQPVKEFPIRSEKELEKDAEDQEPIEIE